METAKHSKEGPKPIKILSEQNYNRIGSEQVIVSPELIVKELVENCIDAKAKTVIVVLEGSKTFEKIRVKDDGYGIPRDNLSLLCKRFSTTKFDDDYDFAKITNLGYRGEALNFVSLNCKVTISSKSVNAKVGYKADYKDGQAMKKNPSSDPVSMDPHQQQGTKIEVSEIFFNNVKRRDELNFVKDSEEIVKLIWKLAFYYRKTFFLVSRNEHLLFKNEFIEDEKAYFVNLVNFRFNKKFGANLFTIAEKDIETELFKMKLFFSDPSIDLPKKTIVVFVNGRLCKIEQFIKAVGQAYKTGAASVNEHLKGFFVYLDLTLDTSTDANFLDVNSCPKKQNIALRNNERIAEYIRLCLEGLLKDGRGSVAYKEKEKPERAPGATPSSAVPFIERSDPTRIKITSAFTEQITVKAAGTLPNLVSDETKKDFLLALVPYSESFLDFFKRVELVGVKNAYTVLIQYETLLLQLDTTAILKKSIEYKLLIPDRYLIMREISIDLRTQMNEILIQGIEQGLIGFSKQYDDDQIQEVVFSRLKDHTPLLSNLGCELEGTTLKIRTLDFLDHFSFYPTYYFLFLLKLTSGPGTPREAADLLGEFFLLCVDDFACGNGVEKLSEAERDEKLKAFYEIVLLEAKREEFCTEIDFAKDLDPIVDLEHTYKTFERC